MPALATWALAWCVCFALQAAGASTTLAMALATVGGLALALLGATASRRLMLACGYPVSLALLWAAGLAQTPALPAWIWLIALGLLLLIYPLNTWRDAPLFPTPTDALDGLRDRLPLPSGSRVLDGGSGLGDGLRALRRQYPLALLEGIEWSWPLRLACALRCPWATVRRGDLWATDWSGYALVYVFQRPESMARAADKAMRELRPGAWLVSLAFPAASLKPLAVLQAGTHPVFLYRMPERQSSSGD